MKFLGAFVHHVVDQSIVDDLSDDEFNELTRWVVPVLPDTEDDLPEEIPEGDTEPWDYFGRKP